MKDAVSVTRTHGIAARADKHAMGAKAGLRVEPAAEEPDAWMRFGQLLLNAIANNPVHLSVQERDAFRRRMEEVARQLQEPAPPPKILIAAGSVVQAVEHYNRQTQAAVSGAVRHLREIARSLLAHLRDPQEDAAGDISRLLAEFGGIELSELQPFRLELENALETRVARRAEREQHHHELVESLRSRISALEDTLRASAPPAGPAETTARPAADRCTGLPLRAEAEAAIQEAMCGKTPIYVAAFYIPRMNLTNARFGDKIGDQVIQSCSQHIANQLSKGPVKLFRWMGPAFVAVLDRAESVAVVAREVQRAVAAPISRFFETSTRTVYLPTKMSGVCIRTAGRTYPEVLDQIERFILRASQEKD
jgi:GGDEF domain-containing protein